MSKKHKHADLIHAWADGDEIEIYDKGKDKWLRVSDPGWSLYYAYRIKPKSPDLAIEMLAEERDELADANAKLERQLAEATRHNSVLSAAFDGMDRPEVKMAMEIAELRWHVRDLANMVVMKEDSK